MQMIVGKKMGALSRMDHHGIAEITDYELERMVYDILEKMEYEDIKELCKALEIICCYQRPAMYH